MLIEVTHRWGTITRLASNRMFSNKLNPHGLLSSVGLTRLAPAARRWCCGLRSAPWPNASPWFALNRFLQLSRTHWLHWLAGHDAESVEIVESRPEAMTKLLRFPQAQCKETLKPHDYRTGSHLHIFIAASKPTGCPILVSTKGLDLKSWGDKCRFVKQNLTQMTSNL